MGRKLTRSNEMMTPHISIYYFACFNDTIDKNKLC